MPAVAFTADDLDDVEVHEPATWPLDVAPLVEFIRLRGGIAAVLERFRRDEPRDYVRFNRMWHRAVRAGHISERSADEFCVHVLKVTPASVWGHELWRPAS